MGSAVDRGMSSPAYSRWPVPVMLLATASLWLPLYLQRRTAHQPNVDDYLYTIYSLNLAHTGSFTGLVHAVLHTGHIAPLVPLLAAPGALHGVDGAVAVELPLLLLLAGGAWLLARRWVSPRNAALIGFATAANQAVLGWALMMHFSVAASALCLWSLAAYLWSEGFQRWGWSVVTGISVGLLLLSRSLAPIYVAGIVLVIGVDLARRPHHFWRRAGVAALIAFSVAGPWWLVSGGTALDYLKTTGYQASSGLAHPGAHLTPGSILDRLRWTLNDLGTVQSIVLLAAPITAALRLRRMPGALLVSGWIALTLVGLATSSNVGTGFGLPVVAVAITLAGALLFLGGPKPKQTAAATEPESASPTWYGAPPGQPGAKLDLAARLRTRRTLVLGIGFVVVVLVLILLGRAISSSPGTRLGWLLVTITVVIAGALMAFRPLAAVVVVTALALGFAAEWTGGTSQSWLGPPYRRMALQSTTGGPLPNIDSVHREIARAVAGRTTLLVRDDDLLNWNGLAYTAMTEHLPERLRLAPFGNPSAGLRDLKQVPFLLAGTSPASYHDYARLLETTAARDGWTETHVWRLACGNTIDLWQKASLASSRSEEKRSSNSSPYRAVVLADSPLAFWPLGDRACEATDATAHHNVAISIGMPRFGARPLLGTRDTSVHFDGKDDEITFRSSPIPSPTKAISIEAWVRADDVPTASGAGWQLVSIWNTALLYMRGGAAPTFVFALYDPATSAYAPYVLSTTTVAPSRVYHVVGTYDGAALRIYVNGVLDSTVARHGRVNGSSDGGAIAAKGWGTLPSPHFHGSLAAIAIYGVALTARRVKAHYREGASHRQRSPAA